MPFSNHLIQALRQRVIGQDYAVASVARAVTLAAAGLIRPNRPLGVLLFLGPAGAGKTHLARALSEVALGNDQKLIQIDCQRLAQDGDALASFHRQLEAEFWRCAHLIPTTGTPFLILLLERIDHAPTSFRESLASTIERGTVVTALRSFPLGNCLVIFTSNLSKRKSEQLIGRPIGFFKVGEPETYVPRQQLAALEEMDNMLGVRLVNNIDEIIIFDQLNEQNVVAVFESKLGEIERLLAMSSIGFIIDPEARIFLVRRCLDDLTHGVRQLNRVVRNYLEFPLADLLISASLIPGTTVVVKHEFPRDFLNFQIMIPRLRRNEPVSPKVINSVAVR